jgi:signal peptidase
MVRYGLGTPEIYASTGVIGAVCVALFVVGIISVRAKPAKALVLARNAEGRVVSINEAEYGRAVRRKAKDATHSPTLSQLRRLYGCVAHGKAKAVTPRANPLQALQARRHGKAKHVVGVAVLAALALGGYASMMVVMGYTAQDAVSGMYSPFMAVPSGSMQPVLNYGDLITVRRETAERIVVGDIIVFNVPSPYDRLASSPTVHRVVEELVVDGKTLFRTKGDSNPDGDPWSVSAENVIGKYAGKVPYLGSAVLFLRGPIGLASITALIALSFLYPYFKKKRGGGANQ